MMSIKLKKEIDAAKENSKASSVIIPGTGIYFANGDKVDALRAKLLGLKDVRFFNLTVPKTLSLAIRVYESYLKDKERFVETFTTHGFDTEAMADFPTRVGVLWYLNVQLGQMLESSALSPELLAIANPLHEKLARASLYLFEKDKSLGPVVADIRKGRGHLDMVDDLARYVVLLDENWDRVEGKCDVTTEDLDQAGEVSGDILKVLTDNSDAEMEEIKDLRNRAAEYLMQGVHKIRRAARYIYYGDPSYRTKYPSLYQHSSRQAKAAEAEETDTVTADAASESGIE